MAEKRYLKGSVGDSILFFTVIHRLLKKGFVKEEGHGNLLTLFIISVILWSPKKFSHKLDLYNF